MRKSNKKFLLFFIFSAFHFSVFAQSLQESQGLINKWIQKEKEYLKKDRSQNRIERRIKILTTGESDIQSEFLIDSPDPSVVHRVLYPDNTWGFRITFTGMFFIEAPSAKEFYQGGAFKISKSEGQYPDGTKMESSYDGDASPWDTIIYQNDQGENIAFGGLMEQQNRGELPEIDSNWSRSRWWGTVHHIKKPSGGYKEVIQWQKSLTRREGDFSWMDHGYGGTLLSSFDSQEKMLLPARSSDGEFIFYYDSVTDDSRDLPWETSILATLIHPSLKEVIGSKRLCMSPQKVDSSDYFEASHRGENGDNGYLVEGPYVIVDQDSGYLLQTFSAGDFTGRYGMFLAFVPPQQGGNSLSSNQALSRFEPVVDEHNELVDFAEHLKIRQVLRATWMGRPVLDYDPDGKLWLRFHFVPLDILPEGAPHEGHPPYEYLGSYPRYAAQIPVKVTFDRNKRPLIVWDLDSKFEHQKDDY